MATTQLKIELLLEEVIKQKASDLHLQVGLPPILRVDGSLKPISGFQNLTEEQVDEYFSDYKPKLLKLRQKSRSKNKNRPDDEFEWLLSYSAMYDAGTVTATQFFQPGFKWPELSKRQKQGHATVYLCYRWKFGHANWRVVLPGPNGHVDGPYQRA